MSDIPDIEAFRAEARAWLDDNAERAENEAETFEWGEGSDTVALFRNLSQEAERAHIDKARQWQQAKSDAGWGSISWEAEYGGLALPPAFTRAFQAEESNYVVPEFHEAIGITMELVAPTIRAFGTQEQKDRYIRRMRRTDDMWCQLFSEPGAGSDLAAVATRAERDGESWVLNGQKVWTSGAQFARYGYILCRTDPEVPKHKGMTAFVVDMEAPGIEVRPLRQMSGGSSFNEVFLSDVVLRDSDRLGEVGQGWHVALTTLSFERNASDLTSGTNFGWYRIAALARHLGLADDPVLRRDLAEIYTRLFILRVTRERATAKLNLGQVPGPEGSLGKLMLTEALRRVGDLLTELLGPRLVADTGEWGAYAWSELLCGVPGLRIAAGSDEVQRNIIGQIVLGLPAEPSTHRGVPFSQLPR